jgi:ATP-dependent DNA helicase RecG
VSDPSINSLQKILELERAKGYSDVAVMGGLDRYIHGWLSQAKDSSSFSFAIGPDFSYAALTKKERAKWVEKVLPQLATGDEPPVVSKRPRPTIATVADQSLDSPITTLRRVSPTVAKRFAKMRVNTIRDVLYFFPNRHLDYAQRKAISELEVGTEQTVIGTVHGAEQVTFGRRPGTEAYIGDETGIIRVVWFNQPWLAKTLRKDAKIVLSGRVGFFKGAKVLEWPEWEFLESDDLTHTGRLVPLYPLTQGLTARPTRRLVKETVDRWADQIPEFLPTSVRTRCNLLNLPESIQQAHYPDSEQLKNESRRRLAFDEFFVLQMGVLSKRRDWQEAETASPFQLDKEILQEFLGSLPFALTSAQQRVLGEIVTDVQKPKSMCRLLQGDVGSGKTVIATAALLLAAANGIQGALMAPTEILAEQHFNTIAALFAETGKLETEELSLRTYSLPFAVCPSITIGLITGNLSQKEKKNTQQLTAKGEVDIVVGTHALIQKGADFFRLGLAVVDEQHRFGVMQRSSLRQKGVNPHTLVMSATPIPRTLALTLYGDLDLSIIDELPPGRKTIKTRWVSPENREKAYDFLRSKIAEGRQAFIICPLIEESEKIETKAAVEEYQRLSEQVFPDMSLGLLHGRMSSSAKEEAMRGFRAGDLDVLVSTSVIEVGIDVPNASIMLVEGADRFGLSQLHQFRGRVGRGEHQSHCLLLSESPSMEARERLRIIEQTDDGFTLAEEDLRLRGPGDFFGTRQSGLPDLRMARLSDVALLELAREEALRLFSQDPKLEQPEHHLLAQEMSRVWQRGEEPS